MTLKSKQPAQPLPGIESLDDVARRYIAENAVERKEHTEQAEQPDESAIATESDGDEDLQLEAVDGRATEATIERTMPASDVSYYAPITRIDREKREVIGTATAEVKDAYRTVIGYEASKDAFARWRGNIREMHQSKAVGRALEIIPDDDNRRIVVRARISKGAQDTWEKILDGTLTGFSIGGKNGKWTKRVIDGEELDYLERYDQAELSVVDNPACPTANFEVVRADGMASDILAKDDEMDPKPVENAPDPGGDAVVRAGARISGETRDALHKIRDHAMSTCGCDECNDMGSSNDDSSDERRVIADIVREAVAAALRDQVAPTMSRVNALLAADASRSEAPDITRRVDDITVQLSAIKDLVEKIAAQPMDGGPVLHGAAIDKRLATQGGNASRSTDADAIQRAIELGFAPPSDPQEAVRAAAKLIKAIPR